MKRAGILFVILFLLASCAGGTVSESSLTSSGDEGQSAARDFLIDNPIDGEIKIPEPDGENETEILEAQIELVDAWRNEMIHAYRELRGLIPEGRLQEYTDAQMGFETHLRNGRKIYMDAHDPEHEGWADNTSIAANVYEIEHYRQRAAELIDLYDRFSPSQYEFLYPEKVDTVVDAQKIPVTFTREDFDLVRKRYGYVARSDVPYFSQRTGTGLLEIDETAGELERYLDAVLREQWDSEKEIPELTNDFIYLAAASNTDFVGGYDPYLKLVPGSSIPIMKEHIEQTAKYLFGQDCKIDFENLHDVGRYMYHDYYGIATIEGSSIKMGNQLVVVDYTAHEEWYDVDVVFLQWSTMAPKPYYFSEGKSTYFFTEEEAEFYCYNILPRYRIRVNKVYAGEEKLYFVNKKAI